MFSHKGGEVHDLESNKDSEVPTGYEGWGLTVPTTFKYMSAIAFSWAARMRCLFIFMDADFTKD